MPSSMAFGSPARFRHRSNFPIPTSLLDRRSNQQSPATNRSPAILKSLRTCQFFPKGWEHRAVPMLLRAVALKEEERYSIDDKRNLKNTGGTVFGAASLIVGTSIGSGILALPQTTSPAGFVPSAVSIVACWAFLVVEALLMAEINVVLTRTKREEKETTEEEEEEVMPIMSFKTMAQETLGDFGGTMATITYVFLGYTSMTAYASESGELLSHILALPPSLLSIAFTAILASLVFFGGTRKTGLVNQWLTALMIGLLVMIEITMASSGNWDGLMNTEDWMKVPRAIPVIVFALVYHDIAPVICSHLDGDLRRIRLSILIGSLIPLISLLLWDGIVLSFPSQVDGFDPLELLFRDGNTAKSTMAEAFSILAVATSLIGTLLGFSSFFQEQFYLKFKSQTLQEGGKSDDAGVMLNLSALAVAVIPPLILSMSLADAFSVATDIAGGYCMMILYGVLPPAMAWSLMMRRRDGEEEVRENEGRGYLSEAKPALIGAGFFATALVAEQLFQDLPVVLHL